MVLVVNWGLVVDFGGVGGKFKGLFGGFWWC